MSSQQASSNINRNTFGNGAVINVKVSNSAKTKHPTKENKQKISVDINTDQNPNFSEMPPPPPPTPPSSSEDDFQAIQFKLETEQKRRIQLEEELLEVQSVAESQLDEMEENKQKATQFLKSIGWSDRAIQTFSEKVYGEE